MTDVETPTHEDTGTSARAGSRPARWWTTVPLAWRRAVIATACLWGVVIVLTVVAAGTIPALPPAPEPTAPGFPGWPSPPRDASGATLLGGALVRFDAWYYLGIAADGYPSVPADPNAAAPNALAFFPLYPLLVAAVGVLTGGRLVLAAGIVSTCATVATFAGLHRLVEVLLGDRRPAARDDAARRAVLVTAVFPTSFFLLAPYTESLHLAGLVWSVVAATRGRPLLAAALGLVAAATRPVGVLLGLVLLLVPRSDGTWPSPLRRIVAASGPVLGLAVVLLVGWLVTGVPLAPIAAQARWQRVWQAPWVTLGDAFRFALGDPGGELTGYHLLDLIVVGAAVAAVAAFAAWVWTRPSVRARRLGLALVVHAVLTMGVWIAQPFPGRPFMSVPRFALVVPAVLLGLALGTARPTVERAWTLASAGLLALHLVLFSRWWYVF